MIPDFIYDELSRRLGAENLHQSKAKAICTMVGIELVEASAITPGIDATVADLRKLVPPGAVDEGTVSFRFETGAEGIKRKVSGRIVFVTTPYGIDGTQGHMISECQALVWRAEETVPQWLPFPEELLPAELLEQAYEEIDALATAKSRAGVR